MNEPEKLIGSGGTANVYEWTNNEVIKIYKPHVSMDMIRSEENIGKLLNNTKLCIPKYIKTVELNGNLAIVYERAEGRPLVEALMDSTDQSSISAKFAKLHYEIHQYTIERLPAQNSMYQWRISRMRNKLGKAFIKVQDLNNSLPLKNKLCHGDFHPLNILVHNNEYQVIDWNDCCSGNPLLDIAWTYLLLNSPSLEAMFGQTMAKATKEFSDEYLQFYSQYANMSKNDVFMYLPLAATRRLDDNLSSETDHSKYENSWLKDIILSLR
ncbi:phosphotransferase [Paenibacillus puldeungensis]|uniref:Phosphotransferase n=1 Tax=Paenibacillus puldeungensis TaxID=696536 RepID=A0ABW3RUS4_9BACL